MKAAFSVIVAVMLMAVSWAMICALLYGIWFIASQTGYSIKFMYYISILLILLISPCFGGYVAAYVTPRLFKTINPSTIYVGFVTIIVTISVLMVLMSFLFIEHDREKYLQFVMFVVQIAAVVIGAKIGNKAYV